MYGFAWTTVGTILTGVDEYGQACNTVDMMLPIGYGQYFSGFSMIKRANTNLQISENQRPIYVSSTFIENFITINTFYFFHIRHFSHESFTGR